MLIRMEERTIDEDVKNNRPELAAAPGKMMMAVKTASRSIPPPQSTTKKFTAQDMALYPYFRDHPDESHIFLSSFLAVGGNADNAIQMRYTIQVVNRSQPKFKDFYPRLPRGAIEQSRRDTEFAQILADMVESRYQEQVMQQNLILEMSDGFCFGCGEKNVAFKDLAAPLVSSHQDRGDIYTVTKVHHLCCPGNPHCYLAVQRARRKRAVSFELADNKKAKRTRLSNNGTGCESSSAQALQQNQKRPPSNKGPLQQSEAGPTALNAALLSEARNKPELSSSRPEISSLPTDPPSPIPRVHSSSNSLSEVLSALIWGRASSKKPRAKSGR